jgi:hypothetical protein
LKAPELSYLLWQVDDTIPVEVELHEGGQPAY